jgi:hypothetical protein
LIYSSVKTKIKPGANGHVCNPSYLEAEIRRIEVPSQYRQIVLEILVRKYPTQRRAGGVA